LLNLALTERCKFVCRENWHSSIQMVMYLNPATARKWVSETYYQIKWLPVQTM
jgi:hypothetical protein